MKAPAEKSPDRTGDSIDESIMAWPGEFQRVRGRRLRILHVGNIANNAFINARLLRTTGVECDVMCYDYYHIMGCPEWEEGDFSREPEDHFRPDWTRVEMKEFRRPRWFAQGPLAICALYLISRSDQRRALSWFLWHVMAAYSGVPHFEGRQQRSAWESAVNAVWRLAAFLIRVVYFVARLGPVEVYRAKKYRALAKLESGWQRAGMAVWLTLRPPRIFPHPECRRGGGVVWRYEVEV